MSRSERLFRLLQALRTLPAPATAAQLARETGVSLRSIYRDIDSLRAAGAEIDGERGVGYRLIEDGTLPPQMFSRIEIEALVLGMAQVRQMGDPALAQAAHAVLGKVAASVPSATQQQLLHAVSQVYSFRTADAAPMPQMQRIREACWREESLYIRYVDRQGGQTARVILPLAIVYVDSMLVLLAWCCLREDFRMFRIERLISAESASTSFRPRRVALLRTFLDQLKNNT